MKLSQALAGITLLAVDTAPIIYYVEEHPAYVDRMQAIVDRLDGKVVTALTSIITLTEVLVQPIKLGRNDLEQAYRDILLTGQNFTLLPVDTATAETAARLRAVYTLRTPDALQIAAAIESGCDAFLTNDRRLNRVAELPILILDDLQLDTP